MLFHNTFCGGISKDPEINVNYLAIHVLGVWREGAAAPTPNLCNTLPGAVCRTVAAETESTGGPRAPGLGVLYDAKRNYVSQEQTALKHLTAQILKNLCGLHFFFCATFFRSFFSHVTHKILLRPFL